MTTTIKAQREEIRNLKTPRKAKKFVAFIPEGYPSNRECWMLSQPHSLRNRPNYIEIVENLLPPHGMQEVERVVAKPSTK